MKQAARPWHWLVALSITLGCGSRPQQLAAPQGQLPSVPPSLASVAPSPAPVSSTASNPTAVDESNPKPARQFTVAVAMLDGDTDRKMEKFIIDQLRDASTEIRKVQTDHLLPASAFEATGGSVSKAVETALSSSGADVLIGGEVIEVNHQQRPRLFIVTDKTTSDSGNGMVTGRYDVSQFMLPGDFWRTLGDLIQLVVLAQATAFDHSHYQVAAVEPFIQRVRALVQSPVFTASQRDNPRNWTWSNESRWQVVEAYAGALRILGEQAGDNAALEESISRHRQALKDAPRAKLPQRWAMTQHNLGAALARLDERESGTTHLEKAVAAYREALKEYTRESAPPIGRWPRTTSGTRLLVSVSVSLGRNTSKKQWWRIAKPSRSAPGNECHLNGH